MHLGACEFSETTDPAVLRVVLKVREERTRLTCGCSAGPATAAGRCLPAPRRVRGPKVWSRHQGRYRSPSQAYSRCSTAAAIGLGTGTTVLLHDEGVIVEPDRLRTLGHV